MTSQIFSRGQAFLAQGTDQFLNKMLSIRKVRLLITSRYISMQSYECVIISKMFLIYFISYGCNGGALVFLGGAEASASPSFALPLFITIKKIIILHLFLGVPAATVGGTGTPWHTRGYAPGMGPYTFSHIYLDQHWGSFLLWCLLLHNGAPYLCPMFLHLSCTCYNGILSFTFIHLADTFILSCCRPRNSNWFTVEIQVLTKKLNKL